MRAAITLAIILWITTLHVAEAQTDPAALKVMETLPFVVKLGDGARIKMRTITRKAGEPDDIFDMSWRYRVSEVLEGTEMSKGYIVDIFVEYAGKPGVAPPDGFDEVVKQLFPAVQVRMNGKFEPMAVINGPEVERTRRKAMSDMAQSSPAIKRFILPMLLVMIDINVMLDFLRPVTEFQGFDRKSKDGSFDIAVTRKNGIVAVSGTRHLTPSETDGSTVVADFTSEYYMDAFKKQFTRGVGAAPGPGFKMDMTSAGSVTYDIATGWIKSFKEEITVTTAGLPKPMAPRIEIIELQQVFN